MKTRPTWVACLLLAVLWAVPIASDFLSAQSSPAAAPPAPVEKKAAAAAPAPGSPAQTGSETKAGPRNPKEQMGVYVFLAWLWVSIIVLVFILVAKVREADRLFDERYLSSDKHSHSG